MGGGLMQLVAYGAQDIYLTGNPQITFFKVVYRRHTNFSMETIEQTINGASTTAGGTGTVTISRNGDLVHKVYVTSATALIEDGDSIVSEVELEIGGQRIDRHYKEWNQIWNELSTDESKAIGLKAMKGCVGSSGSTGAGMVQIPLNFWFCRNPGLALPLIALQYHEVKLKFTWGAGASDVGVADAACKVMCDYIYLDTDERRRFAQVSHEYLIEQLQKQSADTSGSVKLNFNHPVKELIWTSNATNSYDTAQLKLNGHDRFSSQEEEYFQLRQPFDYHTAVPRQNLPSAARNTPPLLHGSDNITALSNLAPTITLTDPNDDDADTDGQARYTSTTKILKLFSNMAADETGCTAGSVLAIVYTDNSAAENNGTYVGTVATTATITDNTAAQTITFDAAGLTRLGDGAALATSAQNDTFVVLGKLAGSVSAARTSQMTKKINVYSFALKPEEHQPSGTCNFSRIDTAKLDTGSGLEAEDNIYAVNYNVLRIMSGMGGLAYSN
jgi:hypothetical protein